MFRLFRRTPKRFLGIDIGTSTIRIVELERGKILKLLNYGELKTQFIRETPFLTVDSDNNLLLSDKEIAEAINSICSEANIQSKEANLSIPDFSSFFTSFELPAMNKEELPQAVRYEVRPYIPLPLSEVTLDWIIAEGEVSKTSTKILVVAIPNGVITQYQEIARLSGLCLTSLEPEVFALSRSLIKRQKEKKIVSLIDIGARTTICSVFEQGILKTSYSFNTAGNELTERLAKSLNIEYNKAEELKKKYGLLSNEQFQSGEILIPLIDSIIGEVKTVFRSHYQNEGKEIERIILAGSSAFLPGLKEYFSDDFQKEVIIANPFLNLSYPSILAPTLEKIGSSYSVAVGLALKPFE